MLQRICREAADVYVSLTDETIWALRLFVIEAPLLIDMLPLGAVVSILTPKSWTEPQLPAPSLARMWKYHWPLLRLTYDLVVAVVSTLVSTALVGDWFIT